MGCKLNKFLITLKYCFLKLFGYEDVFNNCDNYFHSRDKYTVYIRGKKYKKALIKKLENNTYPEGWYPWYVELEDGQVYNIVCVDDVLYLPWHCTKEGKLHKKRLKQKIKKERFD